MISGGDMAEDRKNGPYWVKLHCNNSAWNETEWIIAYWYNESRLWIFSNPIDARTRVDIVGPRIFPPKEKEIRRREGHYWVRIENKNNWEVAYWDGEFKCWNILGTEITYENNIIKKLGPRLSPPEKGEQDGGG